jgi:hypothetical protein
MYHPKTGVQICDNVEDLSVASEMVRTCLWDARFADGRCHFMYHARSIPPL